MKNHILVCCIKNNIIAEKIAFLLTKKKISPHVTIIKNMQNIFIYKNKITKENETLILINSTNKNIQAITRIIVQNTNKKTDIIKFNTK